MYNSFKAKARASVLAVTAVLIALFATPVRAVGQTVYRLNESFDAITSGVPSGWDNTVGTSSERYRFASADGGYGGSRCVRFNSYYNSTGNTNALITPLLDLSQGDWLVTFRYKNPTGGDCQLFISTDGGQTYTTPVTAVLGNQADWTFYSYSLTALAQHSATVKLVFMATSNCGYGDAYIYLDDITVESAPTCRAPYGMNISALTTTSASLSWGLTPDGDIPASYILTVTDEAGQTVISQPQLSAPNNQCSLTGLQPGTLYTVRLQGDCHLNYFDYSDVAEMTFATPCLPSQAPYSENFDSLTHLPVCYTTQNATLGSGVAYGPSGKALTLTSTTADAAYVVFPELTLASNNAELSFRIKAQSISQGPQIFHFGLVSDLSDVGSSFEILRTDTLNDLNWHEFYLSTASTYETVRQTAMLSLFIESGYERSVYVDNVAITAIPTCLRPDHAVVSDITAHSARLSWTGATASQYRLTIISAGDTTYRTIGQSPQTITGLDQNTLYRFQLRALCSAADSSAMNDNIAEFRTECDMPTTALFSEDFEQVPQGRHIPYCWNMGWIDNVSSNTAAQPFSLSSYRQHSPSHGLALGYQRSGVISYLTTNRLPFDQANRYSVSVWMFREQISNRTERIELWVTPTAGDTTVGTKLGVLPKNSQMAPVEDEMGWHEYQFNVPVSGDLFVMVVGFSDNYTDTYFDDLGVVLTPTCPKVGRKIEFSDAGTDRVSAGWQPGGQESAWAVNYTLSMGSNTVKDTMVVVNDTNLVITGLMPQTQYDLTVAVRAICQPGDTSTAVTAGKTFTTACAVVQAPYREDFETGISDQLFNCWDISASTTTTKTGYSPYNVWGIHSHQGNKLIRMNNYFVNNGDAIVRSPLIALGTGTYQFKYDYSNRANCGPVEVSVLHNGAATTVGSHSNLTGDSEREDPGTMQTATVDLSAFAGDTIQLEFKAAANYGQGAIFVDNVVVREMLACAEIDLLPTIKEFGDDHVTVLMADTTVQAWQIAYGPSGTAVSACTTADPADTTFTISGLQPSTEYTCYVRRVCANNQFGPWSSVINFSTTQIPATLPYICGFEDVQENAQWTFANAANGFSAGNDPAAVFAGNRALYVSDTQGTTYNYNIGSASRSYAYRTIHFDAKPYQVDFSWKCTGGESGYDFGRVMLVPVSENLTAGIGVGYTSTAFPRYVKAFDPEDTDRLSTTAAAETNGWNEYTTALDMTSRPGNYNLVVMWSNDGSTGAQLPLSIDNISIAEIVCSAPSTVATTTLTSTAATLDFGQQSAQGWEIVVDTLPFRLSAIPAAPLYRATTAQPQVVLSNLVPNTDYYYTVRTICQAGDTSSFRTPDSFTTPCAAVAMPYVANFDQTGSTRCWSALANAQGGNISRQTGVRHNGSGSMMIDRAMAVSPELQVTSLATYSVTGWAYAAQDSTTFAIGVTTDPADITAYYELSSELILKRNTWTEFTAYFNILSDDPDYADALAARNIALSTGQGTVYFDDIIVEPIPSCPKPTEVRITNITDQSFTIGFTNNSQAQQWIVRTNGQDHLISQNPAVISGLAGATDYSVQVAALCSQQDTSRFTDAGRIRTECAPYSLPYVCGFEQEEGFSATTSYEEGIIENGCWSQLNAQASGVYPYFNVSSQNGNQYSGHNGLYCYDNNPNPQHPLILVLPQFVEPTNNVRVSLYYQNASTTASYHTFTVGYLTDPSVDSTFVTITELPLSSDWTRGEVLTSTAPNMPANARLAIRYANGNSGYAGMIDDISVYEIRTCSDPEQPEISDLTSTSATVTFADTCAAHTAWEYIYGPKGFNRLTATPQAVGATKSFTLTGLNDDSDYDVYVRAICAPDDESNWKVCHFRTQCAPFTVAQASPYSDSFEQCQDAVEFYGCYTVAGNEDTYAVKGKADYIQQTYGSRYSYDGEKCIYSLINTNYNHGGHTLYRAFNLRQGVTYDAGIMARAEQYDGTVTLYAGTQPNFATMSTIAQVTLPSCGAETVHEGDASIYSYTGCYRRVGGYFTVPQTGTYYLAVHTDVAGANTDAALYLDAFTVTEVTGCQPVIITVSNETTSSADLAFNTAAGDEVEYCLLSGQDTIVALTRTTQPQLTLSSLNSSSSYTLYARRICAPGDYSAWNQADFSTLCGLISGFPYSESFDNNFLPNCWSQVSYGQPSNAWIQDGEHRGQTGRSAYIRDAQPGAKTVLTTPQLNMTSPNGYTVSFWMKRCSYSQPKNDEALHVYVSRTPIESSVDAQQAIEIGVVNNDYTKAPAEASQGWYRYEFNVPTTFQSVGFIGLAYHNQYGQGCRIDDLTIDEAPSCPTSRVAGVVNSTTMTTASVTVPMNGNTPAEVAWAPQTANVSPADVIGSTITTDGNALITGLAANQRYVFYFRYICQPGDTSAWAPACTGITMPTDCFEPQSLRTFGVVNDHHAAITWGGAPDAIAYEYELSLGTQILASGVLAGDTIVFDTLQANTGYLFRCRTLCAQDTSIWQSLNIRTTNVAYQLPYICSFDDASVSQQWSMNDLVINGGGAHFTIGNDSEAQNGGQKSLYVTTGGSLYGYNSGTQALATAEVLLEMNQGSYLVSYDWKAKGESTYDYGRAFVLPGTVDVVGLEQQGSVYVDGGRLEMATGWQHVDFMLDIATDGVYKLVFGWKNDSGGGVNPPLAIDNLSVSEIRCAKVKSVALNTLGTNEAIFTVTKNQADDDLRYGVSTVRDAETVAQWTAVNTGNLTEQLSLAGLDPATDYFLFVSHVCDSSNISDPYISTFRTIGQAHTLPYVCNFEISEDLSAWQMSNAGSTNYFAIGNQMSNGGSRALYVTSDGSTPGYDNSSVSSAYATVPVNIPAGTYVVSYDWKCTGESNFDYARLFLAPATYTFQNSATYSEPSGFTIYVLPDYCIPLDGGRKLNRSLDTLDNSNGWLSRTLIVNVPQSNVYNFVAYWRNDGSGGADPGFVLDNLSISELTCQPLSAADFTISAADTSSVTVAIANADANLVVDYRLSLTQNDTVFTGRTQAGDSLIALNGLAASTSYRLTLNRVCSDSLLSLPTVINVSTACGRASLPYHQSFENMPLVYSGPGTISRICWSDLGASAQGSYPGYQGVSDALKVSEGERALQLNSSAASDLYLILPEMDNVSNAKMTFDLRYEDVANSGTVEAGYIVNPDSASSFVSLTQTPRLTTFASYATVFSAVPQGARIAFKYGAGASQNYYAWLDNIRVSQTVDGGTVVDTVCNGQPYMENGFNVTNLNEGENHLTRVVNSQTGADTIYTAIVYMRPRIVSQAYDTVCAGMPYNNEGWHIAQPRNSTIPYRQTFTGGSVTGCDSVSELYLYVLPASHFYYDTICANGSYTFGDTTLTTQGMYIRTYTSSRGCQMTDTVMLIVEADTIRTQVDVCGADLPYIWQGQSLNASGLYYAQSTTAHGCTQTLRLALTVLPADSIVNVSFCQGGQVQVVDTFISTPGTFTLVRVNDAGCDITYYITATETAPNVGQAYDDVCEGRLYYGHGINGLAVTADTMVVTTTKTAELCDSITNLFIRFIPTVYTEFSVTVPDGETTYDWADQTYTRSGDYTETFISQEGCDSVVTLHLTFPVGVDDVLTGKMTIAPNPVHQGQAAIVFTESVGQIARVEIINSYGAVVDSFVPHSTPVSLNAPQASGVYNVRIITVRGDVYVEKLIVE